MRDEDDRESDRRRRRRVSAREVRRAAEPAQKPAQRSLDEQRNHDRRAGDPGVCPPASTKQYDEQHRERDERCDGRHLEEQVQLALQAPGSQPHEVGDVGVPGATLHAQCHRHRHECACGGQPDEGVPIRRAQGASNAEDSSGRG